MGGLHAGHCELIKSAKSVYGSQPPVVVVSAFVNPLQFGPEEDFDNYPRDLEHDYALAAQNGADALWSPSISAIFPEGTQSHFKLQAPINLQRHLCGSSRKGHFDGVSTVILRLLRLLQPQTIVLGEKDWQQLVIIRHLLNDLSLPVKLKSVGTVREEDGLAYSSRNRYLNKSERHQALILPQVLTQASKDIKKGKQISLKQMKSDLLQKGLEVEYLEVVDPFNLQPIEIDQKLCLLASAVRCGKTRLIDHQFLMSRKPIVAIDGPAGAGKSTVTKAFASKLGLIYLDTGAMYRAVTWHLMQNGISLNEQEKILKSLQQVQLELKKSSKGEQRVLINQEDITSSIRSPEITSLVSSVAANHAVREALTAQQQTIGIHGGLVAEGRDIGTAVFPDADVKVFLTASPAERARRRADDLQNQGFDVPTLKELEAQIQERDLLDSTRELSPLLKAQDATELVTDNMNVNDVVQALIELFRLRIPEEVWPTNDVK